MAKPFHFLLYENSVLFDKTQACWIALLAFLCKGTISTLLAIYKVKSWRFCTILVFVIIYKVHHTQASCLDAVKEENLRERQRADHPVLVSSSLLEESTGI